MLELARLAPMDLACLALQCLRLGLGLGLGQLALVCGVLEARPALLELAIPCPKLELA